MSEVPRYPLICPACARPNLERVTDKRDHPAYWCLTCYEFALEDTNSDVIGLRNFAYRPQVNDPMTPLAIRDCHLLGPRGRFAVMLAITRSLGPHLRWDHKDRRG